MVRFVAGFAFAIVTMMVWAAWSEQVEMKQPRDITVVYQNYVMALAHGKDDKGQIQSLHVEPDGSVRCAR